MTTEHNINFIYDVELELLGIEGQESFLICGIFSPKVITIMS